MLGFNDLKGVFQLKWFCNSMIVIPSALHWHWWLNNQPRSLEQQENSPKIQMPLNPNKSSSIRANELQNPNATKIPINPHPWEPALAFPASEVRGHIPGSVPGWLGAHSHPTHPMISPRTTALGKRAPTPLCSFIYHKSLIFWEQLLVSEHSGLAELQILWPQSIHGGIPGAALLHTHSGKAEGRKGRS